MWLQISSTFLVWLHICLFNSSFCESFFFVPHICVTSRYRLFYFHLLDCLCASHSRSIRCFFLCLFIFGYVVWHLVFSNLSFHPFIHPFVRSFDCSFFKSHSLSPRFLKVKPHQPLAGLLPVFVWLLCTTDTHTHTNVEI